MAIYGLFVGAVFLTFLGWFAALFTGRNPFHEYVAGTLCWYARLTCYLDFVTNEYPPFSMNPKSDYPVSVALDQGQLERASVAFRLILVLPALLVSFVVASGLSLLVFVAWFITLISGRLPRSMHDGFKASIRFQYRVLAYFFLVQNRYPRGLFGDEVSDAEDQDGPAANEESEEDAGASRSGWSSPGLEPLDDASSSAPSTDTASGTFPPESTSEDDSSTPEANDSWRLTVPKSGRRVIIAEFVLGGLWLIAQFVYPGYATGSSRFVGSEWLSNYQGTVQNLQNEILNTQSAMLSSSPNWSAIKSDCAQISGMAAKFQSIPQFPDGNVDRHLLLAIGVIGSANQACTTAVAAHSTQDLAQAANAFLAGSDLLEVFLINSGNQIVY